MCGVIGYKPFGEYVCTTCGGTGRVHSHNDMCWECDGGQSIQAMMFRKLFDESRIRGHHAYGIADPVISVISYDWRTIPTYFNPTLPTIAHTRYCQSGDWKVMINNQPLVIDSFKLAMNGVIHMGTKEEFEQAFSVKCVVDNDSEIFLQKLAEGANPLDFISSITGSFAATWLSGNTLYAGRNGRRPLWKCKAFNAVWFASTRDIFLRAKFPEPIELPHPYVESVD